MHNSIVSIQEVATLANLRVLKCSYNAIADLSWVSGLRELRELWVHHNQIATPQIAHLQSLTQLRTLVVHPNPCTESTSYILDVVKALPWVERLDSVVVDQELRDEAQHANERDTLSTGSTEYSLSSLSSRSDAAEEPPPSPATPPRQPVSKPQKKSKQLLAEEFMRNFPVQGYIPVASESLHVPTQAPEDENQEPRSHVSPSASDPAAASLLSSSTSKSDHLLHGEPQHLVTAPPPVLEDAATEPPLLAAEPPSPATTTPMISSIASAVLSLPTFSSDGFLKKQTPKPKGTILAKKKSAAAKVKGEEALDSSVQESVAFTQDEWSLMYPNTTVTAIHIRADGSALAKWPNGSIAVSVDRERDGFRVYAAHKDGQIALSFDASGVGFINYYPSGKMMISTTSSGDGIYFSSEGCAILRQWDVELNLKDEHMEPTDALSDEDDGSLLHKLSDGIGIRLHLPVSRNGSGGARRAKNPIQLSVYFATTCSIRHVFANSINVAHAAQRDACDCVFGNRVAAEKSSKRDHHKPVPHTDLLHEIRAAVANLHAS